MPSTLFTDQSPHNEALPTATTLLLDDDASDTAAIGTTKVSDPDNAMKMAYSFIQCWLARY